MQNKIDLKYYNVEMKWTWINFWNWIDPWKWTLKYRQKMDPKFSYANCLYFFVPVFSPWHATSFSTLLLSCEANLYPPQLIDVSIWIAFIFLKCLRCQIIDFDFVVCLGVIRHLWVLLEAYYLCLKTVPVTARCILLLIFSRYSFMEFLGLDLLYTTILSRITKVEF